ncbi:methylated-DNA--[protein]-cysteine S-methyltransferase [Shewanella sp. YIC-542]|uniref:methylated-DNA--[protein]-cysteine S-methyltransferase n=1 Tax=Shewanella mytili TaxID=3377111 RepID=UPI00398F4CEA
MSESIANTPATLLVSASPAPIAEAIVDTPCGALWLAANADGLCYLRPLSRRLALVGEGVNLRHGSAQRCLQQATWQLQAYFAGELHEFSVPLAPAGTPFQRQVWQQLLQIPYGRHSSYGELAARLQKPGAARAVGNANGANPIAIMIPCHRVIGKNGTLRGYAWGEAMKRQLLALEGADA